MEQRGEEAVVTDVGERREARKERVGEGAGFGGAQGMGGLPGGLVEGEEGGVFVENDERQVGVGPESEVAGLGDGAAVEDVAGGEARAFFGGAVVEPDVSGGDPVLDDGAVEPGEEPQELPVEAFAGAANGVLFVGNHEENYELRMKN